MSLSGASRPANGAVEGLRETGTVRSCLPCGDHADYKPVAPEIQEEILFLPKTVAEHDPIKLRHLQAVALERDWGRQRERWYKMQE